MRFCKPTRKQETGYRKWMLKLPEKVRALAERFDIWTLYRLKTTGDRVMIHSFDEDGNLTVTVSGQFNLVVFERQVFGIPPEELEECDLPGPDEPTGRLLSQKEAHDNIESLRVLVRPDLWVMGDDGKAVRKQ